MSLKAEALIYIGSALPIIWGLAHLFPTKSIIKGFGKISFDNRNIIAMEWIDPYRLLGSSCDCLRTSKSRFDRSIRHLIRILNGFGYRFDIYRI